MMFKRILIPLDGSEMAEGAIPAAVYFARRFGGVLILLHVIERRSPQTVHGERHLMGDAEAAQYLARTREDIEARGVGVESHVHVEPDSDVAFEIAAHAVELRADLVAQCAHGPKGWRGMFLGPLPERVMRKSSVPVLFTVRAKTREKRRECTCDTILVALDGAGIHAGVVDMAADLAKACDATLTVATVVPTSDTLRPAQAAVNSLLPATSSALREIDAVGVQEKLAGLVAGLRAKGVKADSLLLRGEVVGELTRAAVRSKADLIVLATHGRGHFDAFWAGSLTPRLLEQAPCPVLLTRAGGGEGAGLARRRS